MSLTSEDPATEKIEVDLKEPVLAALLAWLWPGGGHFYQQRYRKGMLFMICILGTFLLGMILGNGHVVYSSWRSNDYRWQLIPQLGVGMPAFPAIAQYYATRDGGEPFFVVARRYPEWHPKKFLLIPPEDYERHRDDNLPDGFMAPPAGNVYLNQPDVLSMWTSETQHGFEIGTLYTIVAGLLNVLAIYDAYAGPVLPSEEEKKKREGESSEEDKNQSSNL
jgi:MFS family permease